MNHLVILEAQAGELEKILSGVKCMLVKAPSPAAPAQPVSPGDSLYFLREAGDTALRVSATVTRVLIISQQNGEGLSQPLKEQQPRLQLTEAQYNHWAAQEQVMLVEFTAAQKITVIHVAAPLAAGRTNWIAFEMFSEIK